MKLLITAGFFAVKGCCRGFLGSRCCSLEGTFVNVMKESFILLAAITGSVVAGMRGSGRRKSWPCRMVMCSKGERKRWVGFTSKNVQLQSMSTTVLPMRTATAPSVDNDLCK